MLYAALDKSVVASTTTGLDTDTAEISLAPESI